MKKTLSIDEQFELLELAKQLANVTNDNDKDKLINDYEKGKLPREQLKTPTAPTWKRKRNDQHSLQKHIDTLVNEWHLRQRLNGKKAIAPHLKRECGIDCIKHIEPLDIKLSLFVCTQCHVCHHCHRDNKCKSTYIGEDRATYCCFSKELIHEEYVNSFDGRSKPNSSNGGDGEDDEVNALTSQKSDTAYKDDNDVFRDDDDHHHNKFSKTKAKQLINTPLPEIPKNTHVGATSTNPRRRNAQSKKANKAHFTRDSVLTTYDVNKRQNNILRLYRLHVSRPNYLNTLADHCKQRYLEEKYQSYLKQHETELEDFRQGQIDNETDDAPLEQNWGEDASKTPLITEQPPAPLQTKPEFVQTLETTWQPLFEQNRSAQNLVVPLSGEITPYSSKRHALRLSDDMLDCVRLVIKDLIFNQGVRRSINKYHLDKNTENAKVMVKRYYKESLKIQQRPVLQHADNIHDHEIQSAKRVSLLSFNDNICNFLCVIILDLWFLILGTPRYVNKSSDFDIIKHSVAMLYVMRKDIKIEFAQSAIGDDKTIFTMLPKNVFLAETLPGKKDLSKFENTHRKTTYSTADIKTGKRVFFESLSSIENETLKRQTLEEIRERFTKHRLFYISDLEEQNEKEEIEDIVKNKKWSFA